MIVALIQTSKLNAEIAPPEAWAFNAVDGAAHELMVAVGANGLIVHFPVGEAPRVMPSGTDRDLLDVYVAAGDFAVAVGPGIVLLWDGISWEPIVTEENPVSHAQAWASPDQDILLYGEGYSPEYRLCPRITGVGRQPFCRHFSAPLLAACGHDDSITLLLANGEFHRVNDALIGHDGGFEPAYGPQEPLELKAAWLPDDECGSKVRLPEAYAIEQNGNLIHFNGAAWRPGHQFASLEITGQARTNPQPISLRFQFKNLRGSSDK